MKILFVGISLKPGGIETALRNQVNYAVSIGLDVDLFLFNHLGINDLSIDNRVRILPPNYLLQCVGCTYRESRKSKKTFLIRTTCLLFAKLFGSKRVFELIFKFKGMIGSYDLAISYFHDGSLKDLYYGTNLFVLKRVKARKKSAWIHSDYVGCSMYSPERNQMYRLFDCVVNVSQAMKNQFDALNIIPKERSFLVYNRIDERLIDSKSKAYNPQFDDNRVNVVTVGRLEAAKGTVELLEIANRLRMEGIRFRWYFVGTGVLEDYCKKFIKYNNLDEFIVLAGQLLNPYPYISHSDIFVSGSRMETFGLSICEALILKRTVIAYQYEALHEIMNETNGFVCKTYEEIYIWLSRLLSKEPLQESKKREGHLIYNYNRENVNQFKKLLEL